jgi:glycosyltransferase involved in cell wall biosynthesis
MAVSKAEKDLNTFSLFMPVFNEEANIEKTIRDSDNVLKKLPIQDYEIIAVNDGSKDSTLEVLKKIQKEIPKLKIINHEINKGYGAALSTGFENSKNDLVCFIDSDGQFDFSEVTTLMDLIKTCDVVVGYRMDRQDPLIRKINGWGWTMIANILLGLRVRDIDCAFKLFKQEVVKEILPIESTRGGTVNPEILAKVVKKGFKIKEVGVHHYSRIMGEQTGANLVVIINSFKDLFKLWWKLR